jgi:hypothetical protein
MAQHILTKAACQKAVSQRYNFMAQHILTKAEHILMKAGCQRTVSQTESFMAQHILLKDA